MSDITAAAEEAVAIARGEQAANRVYINGVFYVPEEKYAALTSRVEELEAALNRAAHRLAGAMLSHYAHEAYSIADPRTAITKGESNDH